MDSTRRERYVVVLRDDGQLRRGAHPVIRSDHANKVGPATCPGPLFTHSQQAFYGCVTKPKSLPLYDMSDASDGTTILYPLPSGHISPLTGPVWVHMGSVMTHTV